MVLVICISMIFFGGFCCGYAHGRKIVCKAMYRIFPFVCPRTFHSDNITEMISELEHYVSEIKAKGE